MNKRKVVSMKGKVKVIRQIENGKKKADVWQEFGVVNSMINVVCKNRRKIIKCI
jgi:CENP-B N-terminal DNA-binding domain.